MDGAAEWLVCTRMEMLGAERASVSGTVWRHGRVKAFRRWVGQDERWHAVVVLADGRRFLLEEEGSWIDPAARRVINPVLLGFSVGSRTRQRRAKSPAIGAAMSMIAALKVGSVC